MPKPADVTEAELAVLQLLWERGATTVRGLTDALYPGGDSAHYGTVQKLLQRLAGKRCVRRQRGTGPQLWAAAIAREDLVDLRLAALVDQLCAGSLLPVLTHLTQRRKLSARERDELRRFVDELDRQARQPSKRGKR